MLEISPLKRRKPATGGLSTSELPSLRGAVGNAMNHEYTDAAVEQRESHEDESQDWDLLFVGLAC